jgi:TrmH family RNA methyltransferase
MTHTQITFMMACIFFWIGVQDPGNLGTILRTSQALGHKGIFLSDHCADPWSPKTLRASQGFQFQLPIYQNTHSDSLISHDFSFVVADLNGQNVFDYNFALKTILILGSEGQGISTNLQSISI